jgi:hypothetical protein
MIASLLTAGFAAAASPQCDHVELALAKGMPAGFHGKPFRQTSANFAKGYAQACAEGLVKSKPLAKSGKLFLRNAPEANTGSIYPSGNRMLFEYSFVTHDGRVHVPSAGQIHEAIYCATHGASAKEQEESGRCLPD